MTSAVKAGVRRARKSAARQSASLDALIEKKIAPVRREVQRLRADLDAIEDAATLRIIETAPDEERFPAHIVRRLVARENPLKVFREHRGRTQAALAKAVETSDQYLSQIERGDRAIGKKLLPRLAAALGVDADDLR
jgi:DNA-binding XRE family transcriptional regulator